MEASDRQGIFKNIRKDISTETKDRDGYVYYIKKNLLLDDCTTATVDQDQKIRFCERYQDGTVVPGITDEQLITVLLDRYSRIHKDNKIEKLLIELLDVINN